MVPVSQMESKAFAHAEFYLFSSNYNRVTMLVKRWEKGRARAKVTRLARRITRRFA